MIDLASKSFPKDPKAALRALKAAELAMKPKQAEEIWGSALQRLGFHHHSRGNLKLALKYFTKALEKYRNNPIEYAKIQLEVASIQSKEGQHPESLDLSLQAFSTISSSYLSEHAHTLATAYHRVANECEMLNRIQEAKQIYKKGYKFAKENLRHSHITDLLKQASSPRKVSPIGIKVLPQVGRTKSLNKLAPREKKIGTVTRSVSKVCARYIGKKKPQFLYTWKAAKATYSHKKLRPLDRSVQIRSNKLIDIAVINQYNLQKSVNRIQDNYSHFAKIKAVVKIQAWVRGWLCRRKLLNNLF